MQFSAPTSSGGSGASVETFDGHLVVVEPIEYVPNMQTSYGEKDAVRCTVHDITASTTHEDVLFFPRVLVGVFKSKLGERLLGVIGKGVAKQGQAAPWVITDATTAPEAVQAATAYLTGQVAATITAPAAAPAAPTSALDAALGNLASAGMTK